MYQIDEKAFFQLALKAYDNPHCVSVEEFNDDLSRFSYIKKNLTQYHQSREINERLFLNHITICFNLFNSKALVLLLHRVPKEHWGYLFPFLILLDRLPDTVPEFNLSTSDIVLDRDIIEKLRKL